MQVPVTGLTDIVIVETLSVLKICFAVTVFQYESIARCE
jgi:hypothetical protein